MALTYAHYVGTGSQTDFNVPFEYLAKAHVKVKVDGAAVTPSWVGTYTVKITPAPAEDAVVEVRRETPHDARLVNFSDGSTLVESDLNTDSLQAFFLAQEGYDTDTSSMLLVGPDGDYDAGNRRIGNLGAPVANTDAATKGYVNQAMADHLADVDGAIEAANNAAYSLVNERVLAQQARVGAEVARDAAQLANVDLSDKIGQSEAARDAAVLAKDGALTAKATAEVAAAEAQAARAGAEDALASTENAVVVIGGIKDSAIASITATQDVAVATLNTIVVTAQASFDDTAAAVAASAAAAETSNVNAAAHEAAASGFAVAASNYASTALGYVTMANNAKNDTLAALAETEAARDAALAAWDNFDDKYLGSSPVNPTVDNDGNPLLDGAIYWNSTTKEWRAYDLATTTWFALAATGNASTISSTPAGTLAANNVQDALNELDAEKAPKDNPTFTGTVGGITKAMVGLSNVNNTADANKPISTATQTALDGKAALSHTHDDRYYTMSEVDDLLDNVGGGASSGGIPVGTVIFSPKGTIPPGFLEANGATFDPATYPNLYSYLGNNVLPDMRDRVPRHAGTLAGASGTTQEDAFQGHWHDFEALSASAGSNYGISSAYFSSYTAGPGTPGSYNVRQPITDGTNGTPRTAAETRVKAYIGKFIIKAFAAVVVEGVADYAALQALVAQAGVPVGMIVFSPRGTVPAGWLACEGATFSGATYPDLQAYLGSTTLPNMVDRVPRHSGTLAGAVGTTQEDAFQGHSHQGGYLRSDVGGGTGPVAGGAGWGVGIGPPSDNGSGTPRTATETRVKAYIGKFIIKAAATLTNTGLVDVSAISNRVSTIEARPQVLASVYFNGTGTVAVMRAFNVSSITDLGVGNYRVNFITPMPDTNYMVLSGTQWGGAREHEPSNKTTTYVDIITGYVSSTSNNATGLDDSSISVVIMR